MSENDLRLTRITNLAFALVVLVSYVLIFTRGGFNGRQTLLLVGMGLVYVVLGSLNFTRVVNSSSTALCYVYVTVQLILGWSIFYLSDMSGWMVLMPLVSQAVFCLERRSALAFSLIVWGVYVLPVTFEVGLLQSFSFAASIAASVFFVYLFTLIAVNEQNARAEKERLADELAEANLRLLEYTEQIEELAVAQERNRLAREIHDGLGHYLTAVNMQIKAAQAIMAADSTRALDALGKAQSLTEEALSDVRRSVAALRQTPQGGQPLEESVAKLVEENRAAGIDVDYRGEGEPRPLPPQSELALYRAVQEGLTNVRKHAEASRVLLHLEYLPDSVRLLVQDNGHGAGESSGGYGLLGLRERVHLLGGQIVVETAPEEGFNLAIELPG